MQQIEKEDGYIVFYDEQDQNLPTSETLNKINERRQFLMLETFDIKVIEKFLRIKKLKEIENGRKF